MKNLIYKALSVITSFMIISSAVLPAYAAESSDIPEASLIEQTITADIYIDSSYEHILENDTTEITLTGKMPKGASVKAYPVEYDASPTEIDDQPRKNGSPDTTGDVLLSYDITIFNHYPQLKNQKIVTKAH